MLGEDFGRLFDCIVLVFYHTNDHALENKIRLDGMRVWLRKLAVCESVITVVKLCNVSTKILSYRELASWMNFLIPCRSQH